MPTNAEIEQYYFENFRKVYPVPAGEVIYQDKPDVVIKGNKRIGIELANFYADPTREQQRQISIRQMCVKNAQAEYMPNGTNIEFHFGFNPSAPINNPKTFTKTLVELAKTLEAFPVDAIPPHVYKHIPELSFAYRGNEYPDSEWKVSQTFTIPMMDIDHLLKTINAKSLKAASYDTCDELWLLLIINFIDLAQDQIIPSDLPAVASEVFSRILIYKTGFDNVVEIPLK